MGGTQRVWLTLDLSQTNTRLWGHTTSRQTSLSITNTHTYKSSPVQHCIIPQTYLSSLFPFPCECSCARLRESWGCSPVVFWVSDLTRHDTSWFYKCVSLPGTSSLARVRCCSRGQEHMSLGYTALKDWTKTLQAPWLAINLHTIIHDPWLFRLKGPQLLYSPGESIGGIKRNVIVYLNFCFYPPSKIIFNKP